MTSTRTSIQVNNATGFYPFYIDSMTTYFSDNFCSKGRYQVIKQCRCRCVVTRSLSFDATICYGKVESMWYRIVDTSDSSMKAILDSCGSKLKNKFVDIS